MDRRERSSAANSLNSGLALPRGEERERIEFRDREYRLNGRETRALATVGAFRVVAVDDLVGHDIRDAIRPADLRHLADQRLLVRETLTDSHGAREVVALTAQGKELLQARREPRGQGKDQVFYAGVVKPRELAHDSQLYRAFKKEAGRIEDEGGCVTRVILDYELKSNYQSFLNRPGRLEEADLDADRHAFAEANGLHVVRGHLELPDLRIEYETPDGRLEHRDVELITEHYSRGQLAGKARAGFTCYRAGGSGRGRDGANRGSTPFDPRYLERL
jgi:hypothetical protein